MPRLSSGRPGEELPLPAGWEEARDWDGRRFFIDHNTRQTSWIDPRDRITKPLTFADCVGDELPLGWEEVYDQQVGVYYIDHINKLTQIENPRTQWRQEQERMLKEYLVVAQEALQAKKDMFLIKQQRLELLQQEMLLFSQAGEDSSSLHSALSGSSSSGKFDPEQMKVEVACRRERLCRLKQELAQVKQELQYKEMGVETLQEIDRKMSCSQTNYKLDEAQAIFSELRSIKKFISTGEKERQDLIQCLAKLTVNFQNSGEAGNAGGSELQFCDTGCQTDLIGEYGSQDSSHLVDKVKVNWQYEEAKKKVQSVQHQLAQLDSDSWSGRVEADRDRDFLQLLREKEALLQELEEVIRQQICPETLLQLEEERGRLEGEVQRAHSSQSQGANQRILQQEKRNALLRQLEEATRITTYLHSQLKSMSASSLTVSSSSSRGSLASSRGSLASSRGSLSSISFSDIYGFPQYEGGAGEEPHLRYLLQTDPPSHSKNKRSHDPPQSLASLSSRSSLSSLSPPGSPMDTPYLPPPDCPLTQMTEEYMEQAGGRGLLEGLRDAVCPPTGTTGVTLRGNSANRSVRRARRVSVSEEALATDSGVFEAWGRRTEESDEISFTKDLTPVSEPTQIHLGLLWELSSQSLRLHLLQLKSLSRCVVREGFKVYVKVQLLPLDSARSCFYCCSALDPQNILNFNEGFRIPVSSGALPASFLQISVCSLGGESQEETLGSAQLGLSECEGGVEMVYHWLRVTMLNGAEKSQRRHPENQDALLSRSSSQLEGGEAAQQRRGEASERGWQAESVDSGCSNSTAFPPPTEGPCAEGVASRGPSGKVKVEKGTMTEALIPDPVRVRPKERGGRWGHASPFMRGGTIVRSQTFSPGARSQYVCRLYRSDSDSSTLPKKTPFVRNTLERRTLRYKQQSYRSSLAEQPTRTSLDLELDLQACRSRQKQLLEELSFLRDLKLRLEAPQAQDPPELRDERFCSVLREAQRQAGQSQQQQRQEEAAERRLRKASKEVLQMRGQSQKEPLPVQTFREKMAFFTRPRFNIPPLPADDV